jgi:hypothetical protein
MDRALPVAGRGLLAVRMVWPLVSTPWLWLRAEEFETGIRGIRDNAVYSPEFLPWPIELAAKYEISLSGDT